MRHRAKREPAINRFFDVPMAGTLGPSSLDGLQSGNRRRRGPAIEPAGKRCHGRREERHHEYQCCRGSKPHCSIQCNARPSKSFHEAPAQALRLASDRPLRHNGVDDARACCRRLRSADSGRHARVVDVHGLGQFRQSPHGVLRTFRRVRGAVDGERVLRGRRE